MIDILIIKIPNDKNVWLNKMSQTSDNFSEWHHTRYNSFYKWTKISSLEIIIFELKNDNFKTRDFSPLIKRVITGVLC